MRRVVQVLIASAKGQLLMQHSDEDHAVVDAGKITAFGGVVESGESTATAAVRVLYEETGLDARTDDLEYIGTYADEASEPGIEVHAYVLAGVDEDRVHVYSGQGIKVVRRSDDLAVFNFSVVAGRIVQDYFRSHKK